MILFWLDLIGADHTYSGSVGRTIEKYTYNDWSFKQITMKTIDEK
jgi:hypothetical protein